LLEILGKLKLVAGRIWIKRETRLRHRSSYSLIIFWDNWVLYHLEDRCFKIIFEKGLRIEINLLDVIFFYWKCFGFILIICFEFLNFYLFRSLLIFLQSFLFAWVRLFIILGFRAFLKMRIKPVLSAVLFVADSTYKKEFVAFSILFMKDLMICQMALSSEHFAAKWAFIISLVEL